MGHHGQFPKRKLVNVSLRQNKQRNYGLCVVSVQKHGTTLSVGTRCSEKHEVKISGEMRSVMPWE